MREKVVDVKRLHAWKRGLFVLALLTVSCGKVQSEKVYPVEGKVLFDGQPAAGAIVLFHPNFSKHGPALEAVQPTGIVGEDGSFRLTSFAKEDGALPGEYLVTITWPEGPERPAKAGTKPKKGLHADRLKGRYNSAKSPIRAEVKEGNNSLPPYEIH